MASGLLRVQTNILLMHLELRLVEYLKLRFTTCRFLELLFTSCTGVLRLNCHIFLIFTVIFIYVIDDGLSFIKLV